MRTLTLGLLLVSLAFAGCMSGDDDPEPTTSSSPTSTSRSSSSAPAGGTATSSSSSSSTAPSAANKVPTGTLGAMPQNLTVDFVLNGTDPDGDALSWTLSFGDNATGAEGTQLPTRLNHTYAAVGLYEVVFVLDDGMDQTSYNVNLNLTSGPSTLPGPYVFTGTATGVSEPAATGTRVYGDDVEHPFAVPAGATGLHAFLAWEVGGPVATDLDLYVYDAAGAERGRSACANTSPAPDPLGFFPCPRGNDEEIIIVGVMDAGTWKATVAPFEAQMTEYTLTITLT